MSSGVGPLTGDIAQLLPIVRAGSALGMPEYLDYEPGLAASRPIRRA